MVRLLHHMFFLFLFFFTVDAPAERGVDLALNWWPAEAAPDSVDGLRVAAQGARHHAIERDLALREVFAEPDSLLFAIGREPIIIVRAQRRLAMPHQIEFRHRFLCLAEGEESIAAGGALSNFIW